MRQNAFAIILALAATVQADILHLRDGSRYPGELVAQDDRQVLFRVTLPDGASSVVRSFPVALVARVERTAAGRAAAAAVRPDPDAGADEDECAQMVREALELLDDGDLAACLRALQRAVVRAPPELLPSLDALCRADRGLALDELLATARLQAAHRAEDGRALRLTYATQYERAALGRLLARYQAWLLAGRFSGRTLAEWAAARHEYTELHADARQMVADAGRAAAVIAARLRLDPALHGDRVTRQELVDRHAELARLAAHVLALPGYTASDAGDPAAPAPAARLPEFLALPRRLPGAAGAGGPPASAPAGSEVSALHPEGRRP